MSSFQVSPAHIIRVATYGAASPAQAMGIATLLAAANADSVAYRYREDVTPHEIDSKDLRFAFCEEPSAMEIVKLADCLEYQSCDAPSWALGYAQAVLKLIRDAALFNAGRPGWETRDYTRTAEYQDAPWSI